MSLRQFILAVIGMSLRQVILAVTVGVLLAVLVLWLVFGIRLSIGTVVEQADNLEATAGAATYQDCHGHCKLPHEQHGGDGGRRSPTPTNWDVIDVWPCCDPWLQQTNLWRR